ncbi:DUF4262 domain-containing protein [Stenotrophomonas sp. 24(2023)]|uniref:DUF4262 domain-containing protein n=1 Tax=Stenotrophomonas sp. 24(2023) TaxID=3068324 RepID=UPI0027E0FFC8|nr:DUF4262 domain-containing protein [Stenotrophomonas sp. 24(2023)]WMJ68428.1 DUF4262 domain-containing protein [Stenotrophomonas sp. 24(2023)]
MAAAMTDRTTRPDETVAEHIQRYGWHCVHVLPGNDGQACFSYTIGFNQRHGSPEVMIFNMPRDRAHALLCACEALLVEGYRIQPDIRNSEVLSGDTMSSSDASMPDSTGSIWERPFDTPAQKRSMQ